jgi:hypothetical protein
MNFNSPMRIGSKISKLMGIAEVDFNSTALEFLRKTL